MNDMFVIILVSILTIWSLISTYYCFKFAYSILRMTESIELALDILDEKYNSISQILQIPIFYDSVEVKQVLGDIGKSRDAILQVASSLGRVEEVNTDGIS